ncbi:hypothetical protein V3C99_003762 [Haemonchus contortus]|uniref:Receptor expression-enhancing protein n=1 Tax=Haemonchus contortus TaxID=6289 RepID=A0A7I4XY32_HAECO|nr:TB2 DP1 and HVA22 related protein domain containing protein [Haemonchus contortus]CDJ90829.1 TB2 DP1 and HVA22 related protein domain containing protein [Haemonchus contortus]
MSVPPQVQKVLDDVDKQLHGDGPVSNVLATIEQKSGVRRLHIVLAVAALQALYLIFGHFAQLVCNFMGFIYPAYVSIKAIETATKDDDTQWLTYWVVFAVLSVAEFFSQQIVAVFPVYWLFKSLFLLWLYLPSTMGATKIYHKAIKPVFVKHHAGVDQRLNQIADKARDAMKHAANDVINTHLE